MSARLNAAITWLLTVFLVLPVFVFIMKVLNRTRVRGKRHLQSGPRPLVFVSNHVTLLDDGFIGVLVFPPRALFEYGFIPHHVPEERNFFKGPLLSWFLRRMKCIPIRRGEGVFQPAVDQVIAVLRAGGVVHIFPEGTRTRTGKLMAGKAGVGRVLYETGATVVPCYHRGLEKVLPVGARLPRIGNRVEIIIGPAFTIEPFRSLPNTRETWQLIAGHLMERIAALR
jgi:monolysocardiolipin acyltransferase